MASIKAHGKTPSEDDDLFLTWGEDEPSNILDEDFVLIGDSSEFFDGKKSYPNIRAACEIQNPRCFEGTSFVVCIKKYNNKCF